MLAMFKSNRAIPTVMGKVTIPAQVFVTVLGSDGGTFIVRNLTTGCVSNVSKEMFSSNFERWN
jgi:hypothetical protein